MREQLTTRTAYYVIPFLGGLLVYFAGRLLGLSHIAVIPAALSVWYFHYSAQELHYHYFREERLGSKVTVKARFDFLSGLCRLFLLGTLLTAGTLDTGGLFGLRLLSRLVLAALVAALCHLILPWVFVLLRRPLPEGGDGFSPTMRPGRFPPRICLRSTRASSGEELAPDSGS